RHRAPGIARRSRRSHRRRHRRRVSSRRFAERSRHNSLMKLLLDFDGRRLQGARPFAVLEAKSSRCKIRIDGEEPREFDGDVLGEIRNLLAWSRENFGTRGAAIGFFSYDFARVLEPRAFGKNAPLDELNLPDVRLVFFEELESAPETAPPAHEI